MGRKKKRNPSNAVKILSIEAKDIYNALHLVNPMDRGYNIRNQNGEVSYKKFINTLDYSLELIKLRDVYYNVYHNKQFSTFKNDKEYSQQVINVTFSYSYKEYNQFGSNTYVRAGHLYQQLKFNDHICIENGELLGIEIDVEVENPIEDREILGKNFAVKNGRYVQKGTIPNVLNKADLRRELYTNGFMCDGIEYVRYKRSAGSSRVGKCLFINKELYPAMHKWELCGLSFQEGDKIDLAAWEAYISLTMSSIIDTVDISPESILVIDDYDAVFKDTVVSVTYNQHLQAEETEMEIKNSIFDGESLLDSSMYGKYADKCMLLLRNRFFKSACFNTNIQQWFEDNGITSVEQLNGFTLATDIKQIKMITTPSSIKYLKFGTLRQWLKNVKPTFGIVKYDKPTHYFNGRMVSCHYQLLNTLKLSSDDIGKLLEPNLEYVTQVRKNPSVLRYHLKYPTVFDDINHEPIDGVNDFVFRLIGICPDFPKTEMYDEFTKAIKSSLLNSMRMGHILINGNYSVLFGNGYEMLQQSIGTYQGGSILGAGEVYSHRFRDKAEILGSRSPHINSGNVWLVKNRQMDEFDKYFNLTDEVVCVNATTENMQQRLNGCDYDSDTLLLTNNPILIARAKEQYNDFKVPTCFIEAEKTTRYFTNSHKTDLDIRTSVNKIGEIVNLSQYLNSIMWNNIHKGQSIADNKELYYDICKLAVLSNIEIDRAKKEYVLSSSEEIGVIKDKWKVIRDEKTVKPMFFKNITRGNGYTLSPNVNYTWFHTSMDYLCKQIGRYAYKTRNGKNRTFIPLSSALFETQTHICTYSYRQCKKIIREIEDCVSECGKINSYYSIKAKAHVGSDNSRDALLMERKDKLDKARSAMFEKVDKLSLNDEVCYLLLKEYEEMKYSSSKKLLFEVLCSLHDQYILKHLEDKAATTNSMTTIVERRDDDSQTQADVLLFDYRYIFSLMCRRKQTK